MDNEKTTQNGRGSIGQRALYMVLFALFYSVAELVLVAVVMIQFLIVLFGAESNRRLLLFGAELGRYIYQIIRFLTFNNEQHVYPFGDWPRDGRATGAEPELDTIVNESDTDGC